jgi:HEAT repeat protein
MLHGKSLFGRREDSELRACAAVALGRINTARAQESLRRAATEKDVVVRIAANRALRGGSAPA